ncbi:hypothetical protein [uncultured Endozoicomonas sp.]|uniref:hypothetical protein n=1 Tax=uncultured Endozoicomonas sp. TaxID=432652 RepID=UPI0026374A49|nr:hypothetical protein [uncultured Endozoicomonas sp.]
MLPGLYDFEVYQGASWSLEVTYRDAGGKVADFTGWAAQMQVRNALDGTLFHELSTDNGGIVLAATEPNIRLRMPGGATAAIVNRARYDLFVEDGVNRLPVMAGRITSSEAATHD